MLNLTRELWKRAQKPNGLTPDDLTWLRSELSLARSGDSEHHRQCIMECIQVAATIADTQLRSADAILLECAKDVSLMRSKLAERSLALRPMPFAPDRKFQPPMKPPAGAVSAHKFLSSAPQRLR